MIDCNTCHEPTPENAIMPETGDCVTCVRKRMKATESPAPSGQAEFELLGACLAEHRKVIAELVQAVNENDRWIGKTCASLLQASKRASDLLAKQGT